MPAMIVDGRAKFGVSLGEFVRQPASVQAAQKRGLVIPPLEHADPSAQPSLARVNHFIEFSRWIADCPDCGVWAQYVWREGPLLLFCLHCGNRSTGGTWRPIAMPDEAHEIERLLLLRPEPATRNWHPGETLEDLRQQNRELGIEEAA